MIVKKGWTGTPLAAPHISLSVFDIVMMSERVVTGSFRGSINLRADIPKMVELCRAGRENGSGRLTRTDRGEGSGHAYVGG